MKDQTQEILSEIASKLGTTAEYLWAVLLNQAPISATINLIQVILVLIGCFLLYKTHIYFRNNEKYEADNWMDDSNLWYSIPMVLAGISMAFLLLFCFLSIDNIVNGYFNPEYWALKKILRTI